MKNSRFVAVCGIAAALIFLLSSIPQTWGIPFLGLLPILVVIVGFRDIGLSVFVSVFAGVVSWLFSYVRPTVVSEFFHTNPLLPIFPRFIAGMIAHFASVLTFKITKKNIWATCIVGGAIGSFFNTMLVVCSLYLFVPYVRDNNSTLLAYIVVVLPTAAIELLINSLVVPILVRPILTRKISSILN
ncbi:MAG: ECF transporter S component [Firmicutes bacterium]|nr:ECF transporter S component [Bacillota bacterium]MCL1953886.1 ECF transporter S component [Bacillota bacterium]